MNLNILIPRPGIARGLVLWAALLLAPAALAQDAPGAEAGTAPTRTLDAIDVGTSEGGAVRITMTLSQTAPDPVVFSVDKPARLSLDLADTKLAVTERFKRVSAGRVRSVAAAEGAGRTRIVVEMSELAPYTVRADGNQVVLEVQGGSAGVTTTSSGGGPAGVSSRLLSVDFRRGEKGEGRVIVRLADPRTIVDVREEGNRVLAQFRNTDVDLELQKRLDVLDFATPVKFIDILREGRNTSIYLTPVTGIDFEQVAYQAQDQFTIELQPVPEDAEAKKRREQVFSGERISLSFQNIDVRALLQIIGDVSGNNVVISDGVRGELAMRLINVPWDQALDIILRTKGLGVQQQGNVMLIAPLDEIASRAKAEGEATKQKDEGAPLRSEIIQVNYAKASGMAALLKAGSKSLLSARGQVSVDDRTNTLLVLETRERLGDIRNLVARLDVPVRQVLIESRIVIANNDFSKSLGARFGVTGYSDLGREPVVVTSGSVAGAGVGMQSLITSGGTAFTFPADRLNVNLPVASAGRIGFAILGSNYLVDLELSALQAEGRGEVLSTPRVVTANSKQASIEQGVEIPYQEASSSGATSVSFKKAVLGLQVTPQITPDDRIIMDLNVKNDSRGQDVSSGFGQIPSIDTREVTTQVLVQNGETVVLGGVYQQTQSFSVTKVPLLGDLPLLGYLFRTTSNVNNKRELLIFVTPKILGEGIRVN
ncbi:MAG: type IV pilus secretin PilQ [Nevskiaceae bacterium]